MITRVLLALALLQSQLLWAQPAEPELCADLPSEAELEERWGEMEALWQAQVREGVFRSPAQLQGQPESYRVNPSIDIAYAVMARPAGLPLHGNIVIANGRTEGYLKYREMAATLWCRGYAVYMIDHRGQGLSGRVLAYEEGLSELKKGETPVQYGNRGHVEQFDNYVRDLEYFVDELVPDDAPRILLAHSMGGAIGTRLIQRRADLFSLAIMSSPMFGVPAQFACSGLSALGGRSGGDAYIPGGGPWDHEARYPYREDWGFKVTVGWHYTGSAVRHNIWHREYAEPRAAADGRSEDLRIGAPTLGWFGQACEAVEELQADAANVDIPMLLLIAADDTVIPEGRQMDACGAVNRLSAPSVLCQSVVLDGARHEMFIERDEVREQLLREIFGFLKRNLEQ